MSADQARGILTHAGRARMVKTYTDLADTEWTAHIRRRFEIGALFANHEVLLMGRITLSHSGLRQPV
ncbi:hypothetical protein U5640_28305 [Streptomyces sp. SS7]|uniref:hypothetical protein n=1 Tax=Streptomyces sp. SS7 TaxID=3108485 RepID=UPI0030EDA89C